MLQKRGQTRARTLPSQVCLLGGANSAGEGARNTLNSTTQRGSSDALQMREFLGRASPIALGRVLQRKLQEDALTRGYRTCVCCCPHTAQGMGRLETRKMKYANRSLESETKSGILAYHSACCRDLRVRDSPLLRKECSTGAHGEDDRDATDTMKRHASAYECTLDEKQARQKEKNSKENSGGHLSTCNCAGCTPRNLPRA